jgi:hypothetical protein
VRRVAVQVPSKTARRLREARWTWRRSCRAGTRIALPKPPALGQGNRFSEPQGYCRGGRSAVRQTAAHVTFSHGTAGPVSICRLCGLLRLGDRGQRLIVCPLLEAALELFRRRRGCPPWMPHDPYDLAHAPTPTASCRRPTRGGRALAVSAAALTDHVRDRWHWMARLPEVGFPFGGSARRLRIEKPRNLRRSRSRSVARGEGRQ